MIPRQRGEPIPRRDDSRDFDRSNSIARAGLRSGAWPTVDETADAIAMMTADTVLQILKGEGVYYGLGDQHVPEIEKHRVWTAACRARQRARRRARLRR